ncbi:hypothetical protein E2562_023753 [Oryza meyeriana var. granulata]|uniref:RNase H type-1 domain-containing protein n=1 Tax=Oryza meyeriana var. granulata TaxID=110450 RepID=A0A6G1DMH7_9ORYZ|nr:hypothetical protein E2562_023753 [Oryza meyeriana var. granulata]
MKQWIFDFVNRSLNIQNTVLAVTFWHIWQARNDVKKNNTSEHPCRVAQTIVAWVPPPAGTFFISTDAAIFQSSRQMGLGVVIRDHNETCVFACNELVPGITTPEVAEAVAIRRALSLAWEEGFHNFGIA